MPEHAEKLLHLVGDVNVALAPLLLEHHGPCLREGREALCAGVVQPALHAVAALADASQPIRAHAENFGHRSEDDVRHPHDVAVHLVVHTTEVGDVRVRVDWDLLEPGVVWRERHAGGQEALLVERGELIRALGVLASKRAVATLAAIAPLLIAHPRFLAPVHEEHAKQLIELAQKLRRDAVIAEADESNFAQSGFEFEQEGDTRGGRTFGVVAE